ncbi:MAG TPA: sulfur carrier protein ThiS [Candidatus Dormibacteraeota bacterium]|nr:sulfur carrier protein ThiS [Candidatus Dormibacteraeota bacterium]
MTVTVNGESRELREGLTIAQLLVLLGTAQTGIAVACNDAVVRRSTFGEYRIAHGDRIEVIQAVAGG